MEDEETAAARLEAALERIAQRATALPAAPPAASEAVASGPDTTALAARLDGLIATLRGALQE